jgi:periplasmic protein TonB
METKKSKRANLEKKKTIFLQIGIVVALLFALVAFEWKLQERPTPELFSNRQIDFDDEILPIIKEPEIPKPVKPTPIQEFEIVDDKLDVPDIVIKTEIDPNETIGPFVPFDNTEIPVEENEIFVIVEEWPEFPGGERARQQFLKKHLVYPVIAQQHGIEGRVYVGFVVEKDGSITNVNLSRGIGGGCDEEAIRVTRLMPKWKPGMQSNKPVRTQFSMPIRFQLNK